MAGQILVSGLINLEITLPTDSFPIQYAPVRYPFFGVNSSVSGVGFNVAKALTALGDDVQFLSLIGQDPAGKTVEAVLQADHISSRYVLSQLAHTPHSVIIFDQEGKRAINVDLKDIQDQVYLVERFEEALQKCSLAALCNINFSRPFLLRTLQAGKIIATDVHVISNLDDDYNRDFMAYAHILFMSDEGLPVSPENWARQLQDRFGTDIIVIGLGKQGALLAIKQDNFMERLPAVYTRPIKNTIGAGDSLFSAFIHFYNQTSDPYESLRKAIVFASYKIGGTGGADDFLSETALNEVYTTLPIRII